MYAMPMAPEAFLTKRNVWLLNAIGFVGIYLGFLLLLASRDSNIVAFARFLTFSGGLLGVAASTAGALGSPRTTDMQNLGLLIWAGLLFVVTTWITGFGSLAFP